MITYHSEPQSPVIELHVGGQVTNAELEASINRFRGDLEAGKTRVLEIIDHFSGMEPKALWTDLKMGLPLAHKVSRVAVVADQAWIRAMAHLGTLFTSAELKVFEPDALSEARLWIAGP
jgi:hypothetical protein